MFAYVKELTEGAPNPYSIVHVSRIFHYAEVQNGKQKGKRVKFNPLKYDINSSYGIVQGKEIVKHQVLVVKDTEQELKDMVASREEGRLRSIPCPKRLSTGPTREPLSDYILLREADEVKEADIQKNKAKRKVGAARNSKLLNAMNKKGNLNDDPPTDHPLAHDGDYEDPLAKDRDCDTPQKKLKLNVEADVSRQVQTANDNVPFNEEVIVKIPSVITPLSSCCDKCPSLEKQLQMALKEAEDYRLRCFNLEEENRLRSSDLEELKKQNREMLSYFQKMETDIGYIKDLIESAKAKAEHRKQVKHEVKQCPISRLKNVASSEYEGLQIPEGQVHLADGKYFMTKVQIVRVEQANGLRPRLKKLLTYMYKQDLPNWVCKLGKGGCGKEIPAQHIKAFIGLLQAMQWKKEVDLSFEKVSRELSKALSELKADKYPCSDSEEGGGPPPHNSSQTHHPTGRWRRRRW